VEQTGAERALARMRTYTTASLVSVVVFFTLLCVVGSGALPLGLVALVAGALATWMVFWWENPPPLWLTVTATAINAVLWSYVVLARETPMLALMLFLVALVPISHLRRHRAALAIAATALGLLPVLIAWIASPALEWYQYALGVVGGSGAAAFLLFLNRYAWGLYLEIDSARRLAADLAVVQERYRFATDLHDIQGHTLHVLRLKTQLAARLIDHDPATAKAHLEEADTLIAETLANTRALAFGDRTVTLAGELANASHLFEAAGIDFAVIGTPTPGPHEELFGLVLREATTNILRHAQSSSVTVDFEPHRMIVRNDGSPATSRAQSGLARLAERFAAIGGSLNTSTVDGVFSTEAATA
jgi:two-component system sensor histidine kinase DesK